MSNFKKYQDLYLSGASIERIFDTAQQDGLDQYALWVLMRDHLHLSNAQIDTKFTTGGIGSDTEQLRSHWAPTKKRKSFRLVFDTAQKYLMQYCETGLGRKFKQFKVDLKGGGLLFNEPIDADTAFDLIYLGDNKFFFSIHVGVERIRIENDTLIAWMHILGHDKANSFAKTLNLPPGSGPFKINPQVEFQWDILTKQFREIIPKIKDLL